MTIRDRDALRTVWLFGRPYWWDQLDDGRLTLRPGFGDHTLAAKNTRGEIHG